MSYQFLKNDFGKNILLRNNVPLMAFIRDDSKLTKLVMVNNFSSYDYDVDVISLTAKMLLEGTKKYSYEQLSDMIEFYGAEVKAYAKRDANIFSITVLNEYFHNLFDIFNDIFVESLFSPERLENVKMKEIEKLNIENSENSTRVVKRLRQALYDSKKPYGDVRIQERLKTVTVDDIKSCFSKLWINNCMLFVTGPSNTIEYIKDNVADVFCCDSDNAPVEVSIGPSQEQIIKMRDNTCQQVNIALGSITIPVIHEDYLKLLCTISFFGGGYLGSRLMQAIREKKGLTYGISANISSQRYSNFLCIRTAAKKEFKDEILYTIDHEIERLKNDLVAPEELDNFKKYFCGEIISLFTNVFSPVNHLLTTRILNMKDSYYYDLFMTVEQLTAEDIKDCAVKYLDFKKLTQVFIE
ncbi:MAG: insulinase family protein [Cytophagales bacterium]|nr:insulinase family protein [Cytophagales bacterium]